jgi:acyl-CoA synthetase (AMP-forming)/AMP-acid ligase II/acyl carrier protein
MLKDTTHKNTTRKKKQTGGHMSFQLKNYSLANQLKWRAIHLPDRLALCYLADGENETQRLTYRELDADANRIAAKLQTLNLKNKYALMLYSSGLEFVKAFFGCLYAGVIAVPTYVPKSKNILQKIESIQLDCGAKIILTTQEILDEDYLKNSKLSELVLLATDRIYRQNQIDIYHDTKTLPEDTVFIQYTSGSTSQPKGAIVTNKNIMVNQIMLQHIFELNEDSVGVTWLPLFHDMGLIASLMNAIFVGYPIYIMPPSAFIRNPIRWLKCISKYKGTYSCAPNFAYDLCVKNISAEDLAQLDLSTWKKAINAAEPIQPTTLKEFAQKFSACGFHDSTFTPAYGLAEATVFVSGKNSNAVKYVYLDEAALQKNKVVYPEDLQKTHAFVSCGNPNFLGQQIKIINPDTGQICINEIGEICIAGDHTVKGYLNKPELSKLTFEMIINGVKYTRTGDLGFLDEGGELYITGRIKDLIIINGSNYYPQDLELTAESQNELIRTNSIAAFSIDKDNKEQLVVVVELNRKLKEDFDPQKMGSQINAALLRCNFLTAYEIVFIACSTLPKTTSGKIQRQTCKKFYLENTLKIVAKWQSPQASVAADISSGTNTPATEWVDRTEITNCITQFFAKTAKVPIETITTETKIADYGLDSLQMAALSVELEKIVNLTVPEKIFYECATIADMVDFLVDMPLRELQAKAQQSPTLKLVKSTRKIAVPKFTERDRKIS